MYNIDIGLLNSAYLFYLMRGYKPLSAPMIVDKDISDLTLPEGREAKEHLGQVYVGSAEQSFYQLLKDGLKPEGSYMMLTPCHRDEVNDKLHLDIFLKIELVSVDATYVNIAKDVFDFYTALGEKPETRFEGSALGLDIEIDNVEVGSFGYRIYDNYMVNYGTGLALPRFSQVRGVKYED